MARRHNDIYMDKLISPEKGLELAARGYKSADLHVHTNFSYDVPNSDELSPQAIMEKGKARNLDFIAITDHDTIDGHSHLKDTFPGFVPGAEIKIKDMKTVGHTLHINVYELNKTHFIELEKIATAKNPELELFISYCKDNDLPYVYNHPFWFEPADEQHNIKVIPDLIEEYFPVIEYNMHRVKAKNLMAVVLAGMHGKGLVCNTDTHIGDVGAARTYARGDTFREFYNNLKAAQGYLVTRDITKDLLVGEAKLYLDLFRTIPPNEVLDYLEEGAMKEYPRLFAFIRTAYEKITSKGKPGWIGRKLYSPNPYSFFIWLYVVAENSHARKLRDKLDVGLSY